MSWVPFNDNPKLRNVGDCAVRAIGKACGLTWREAYLELILVGLRLADMPSANSVWGAFLASCGFTKEHVADSCEMEYTVVRFAADHPEGTYVLALSGHVVTVIDGDYYDTWDSGSEIVLYDWRGN